MAEFTRSQKISNIKVGNYVVATRNIGDIEERSVGLVKEVSGQGIKVLFIGKNKTVKTDGNHVDFLDIEKTGKPYKKKICNICHLLKDDLSEFAYNQNDKQGRKTSRPTCIECRKKYIDGVNLKNDEKKKLDNAEPKDLFTCPICEKTSIVGVTAKFVRDHNHTTGKARAWICDSCNTGLGRFKDDIKLLQKAINYLKKIV